MFLSGRERYRGSNWNFTDDCTGNRGKQYDTMPNSPKVMSVRPPSAKASQPIIDGSFGGYIQRKTRAEKRQSAPVLANSMASTDSYCAQAVRSKASAPTLSTYSAEKPTTMQPSPTKIDSSRITLFPKACAMQSELTLARLDTWIQDNKARKKQNLVLEDPNVKFQLSSRAEGLHPLKLHSAEPSFVPYIQKYERQLNADERTLPLKPARISPHRNPCKTALKKRVSFLLPGKSAVTLSSQSQEAWQACEATNDYNGAEVGSHGKGDGENTDITPRKSEYPEHPNYPDYLDCTDYPNYPDYFPDYAECAALPPRLKSAAAVMKTFMGQLLAMDENSPETSPHMPPLQGASYMNHPVKEVPAARVSSKTISQDAPPWPPQLDNMELISVRKLEPRKHPYPENEPPTSCVTEKDAAKLKMSSSKKLLPPPVRSRIGRSKRIPQLTKDAAAVTQRLTSARPPSRRRLPNEVKGPYMYTPPLKHTIHNHADIMKRMKHCWERLSLQLPPQSKLHEAEDISTEDSVSITAVKNQKRGRVKLYKTSNSRNAMSPTVRTRIGYSKSPPKSPSSTKRGKRKKSPAEKVGKKDKGICNNTVESQVAKDIKNAERAKQEIATSTGKKRKNMKKRDISAMVKDMSINTLPRQYRPSQVPEEDFTPQSQDATQ